MHSSIHPPVHICTSIHFWLFSSKLLTLLCFSPTEVLRMKWECIFKLLNTIEMHSDWNLAKKLSGFRLPVRSGCLSQLRSWASSRWRQGHPYISFLSSSLRAGAADSTRGQAEATPPILHLCTLPPCRCRHSSECRTYLQPETGKEREVPCWEWEAQVACSGREVAAILVTQPLNHLPCSRLTWFPLLVGISFLNCSCFQSEAK